MCLRLTQAIAPAAQAPVVQKKKSDPELVEGTELEKINIEKHESRPSTCSG